MQRLPNIYSLHILTLASKLGGEREGGRSEREREKEREDKKSKKEQELKRKKEIVSSHLLSLSLNLPSYLSSFLFFSLLQQVRNGKSLWFFPAIIIKVYTSSTVNILYFSNLYRGPIMNVYGSRSQPYRIGSDIAP